MATLLDFLGYLSNPVAETLVCYLLLGLLDFLVKLADFFVDKLVFLLHTVRYQRLRDGARLSRFQRGDLLVLRRPGNAGPISRLLDGIH